MQRVLATIVVAMVAPMAAGFPNCDQVSVGLTPLGDLGQGLYLGQFQGGLYPDGVNTPPAAHTAEGIARANAIEPLDTAGNPDPAGRYLLLSIGMSNTTQEFCSQGGNEPCDAWTFMGQAAGNPGVNDTTLRIVNGARGGEASAAWDSPADANYDRIRDQVLAPRGLTEAQVQIAWVKTANPGPQQSLPSVGADAFTLVGQMGDIARALKTRYPNLQQVFFSSRIYAGYASTTLNPEPYAYESAFAVKWLIEAQIQQMAGGGVDQLAGDLDHDTVAPWIAWGPYPWADGLTARADGLRWHCSDMQSDGTHPAMSAEQKVGTMLLNFFLGSPFTEPWFTPEGGATIPGDLDGDGTVGILDFLALLGAWGPCPAPCSPSCLADLDGDCIVGITDFLILLGNWG